MDVAVPACPAQGSALYAVAGVFLGPSKPAMRPARNVAGSASAYSDAAIRFIITYFAMSWGKPLSSSWTR
jgi:hypothetical protein